MILGVLRFDARGPPYFVFNQDGSLRWPEGAFISEVWLDGSLQAFDNQSLAVTGENSQQVGNDTPSLGGGVTIEY